jgi:hypothetical protein
MGCLKEKNILIGAQVFCWPKIINPLGHKTGLRPKDGFVSCVGKTQILIEFLGRTQKSFLVAKKSLEDFVHNFCC